MFKWPDWQDVHDAVCAWAMQLAQERRDVLRVGYMGSYARGDWGVGSDLDLIVIVSHAEQPFITRVLPLDLSSIPVPVDVLVYTHEEWVELAEGRGRFYRTVESEAVWLFERRQTPG